MNMMKKPENEKVIPYPLEIIKEVILHPETYNLRDYTVYKKLDEKTWIEDYGEDQIYKLHCAQITSDKIILESNPIVKTSGQVNAMTFTFKPSDNGQWCVSFSDTVRKGNFFNRFYSFVNNHTTSSTYYTDTLDKLIVLCAKAQAEKN